MKNSVFQKRIIVTVVICIALAVAGFARLFVMQGIAGDEYVEKTEKTYTRTVTVKATRGEIYDRNGRVLVTNRQALNVQIDKLTLADGDLDRLILNTISLLRERGENYADSFMVGTGLNYIFDVSDTESSKYKKLMSWCEEFELTPIPTPRVLLESLRQYYGIDENYDIYELRDIIAVRYEMERTGFSSVNPFVICEDISVETATEIKERTGEFKGLEIVDEAIRIYEAGSMACHVIGNVGVISKSEYEENQESGYLLNDVIGKGGAEKAFESYLRGKNGIRRVTKNSSGSIVDVEAEKTAYPGNNVVLTIDSNVQTMGEKSLAYTIEKIATDAQRKNNAKGYDACAGAFAVISVKTGEVIAMGSNPGYDLSTYNKDYAKLLEADNQPLYNRAIQGLYAPGSTFKMLTAIAGLEEGVIDVGTYITCAGIYSYYAPSYMPRCWVYNDYGYSHGPLNVIGAIQNSCNCFFYEVGRRVGISKLNEYGALFGLGEYTGIELSGEKKGVLAGEDYRRQLNEVWYDGETLSAAIGQNDNQFTPLQLANYIATIVNGGTRYTPHILKEVRDYVTGDVVYAQEPVAAAKLEMSEKTYAAVMQGMRKVTEDGTASSVFSTYPIEVGGKTGSADVGKGSANGVFVAFAPFDDPEIAVCIIVEHGAHGNSVAPVARDILDAYFYSKTFEDIYGDVLTEQDDQTVG